MRLALTEEIAAALAVTLVQSRQRCANSSIIIV